MYGAILDLRFDRISIHKWVAWDDRCTSELLCRWLNEMFKVVSEVGITGETGNHTARSEAFRSAQRFSVPSHQRRVTRL